MRTRKERVVNMSGWMRACFGVGAFGGFATFSLPEEDEPVL
jgi:hypothetical protein